MRFEPVCGCVFQRERQNMKRTMGLSIQEIADAAGVSTATVSRVLNNRDAVKAETRQKVYQVLSDHHIDMDQVVKAAENNSRILLFILPFEINAFFDGLIRGARASAFQHGYRLLIHQDHIRKSNVREMVSLIKNTRAYGAIVLNYLDLETQKELTPLLPIVQCCSYDLNSTAISSVSLDDLRAGQTAIQYLHSINCRKTAFISGPTRYADNLNRKLGYLQAMRDFGFEPPAEWIVELQKIDYSIAFSTAKQLLSNPNPPDSFFAVSDIFAAAVVNAARQLDLRVPEDVCVVGFDNIDYALISRPALTTIGYSQYQMGYSASELLIDKIQNPNAATQHLQLPFELIIRDSTRYISGPVCENR